VVSGVVVGSIIGGLVYRSRNAEKEVQIKAQREAAQLKEEAHRKFEEEYREESDRLRDMITERGISVEKNHDLRPDQVEQMRKTFAERSKVFDFQNYSNFGGGQNLKYEIQKRVSHSKLLLEARELERINGDTILSDEERKLAEIVPSGGSMALQNDIWKLREKPGFDKYLMDRIVLSDAERLLKMSDRDFASFMQGDGKNFLRRDTRLIEDYLGRLKKSVADDVEIDIEKSVVQAANDVETTLISDTEQAAKQLEVKVDAKVEEAVVKETDKLEAWEETFESDLI
jgi:hypothetical protein